MTRLTKKHFVLPDYNMKNNLILLLILGWVTGCTSLPVSDLTPDSPALRVVTYNINWGGANAQNVVRYLLETDADLIFLQETHRSWESYLKKNLSKSYPYSAFLPSGGAGGIAFMSKYELSNVRALEADIGWFPGLIADVKTELGPVQVLNVHLKPPLTETGSATASVYYDTPALHRRELAHFLKAADLNAPLIIAGDYNESERRGAVKKLLANGYTDALSLYDTRSKTWLWKVMPGVTLSNRYDHIIFSKHFYCTGAEVTKVNASDHLPVLAALKSNEGFQKISD